MNKGKSYNSNNKIQPKYRILSFIFALIMFFGSFLQDITVFAKVQDSDFKLVDNVEMDDESSLDYNSKRNIDVQIVWNENFHQNVKKPKSVTIKLFEDNKDAKRILELTEDNGWKGTFDELYVYNAKGQKINYTIDEVDVPNYNKLIRGNQDEGFTVANTYWPEKVSFEVQKKWFSNYNLKEEGKKRPDHVIIELLENKNPTGNTIKLELANEWKYGFWDLPKYDENNNEIIYTIREFEIEGYKTRIYGDSEEGFIVTNTFIPTKTRVNVTKDWFGDENALNKRPSSVTIKLLADGVDTEKRVVLNQDNKWEQTFEDLPIKDDNGKEIEYSIEEVNPSPEYKVILKGDPVNGFNLKTIYKLTKIEIPVTKAWEDKGYESKRPQVIFIKLYANDREIITKSVTSLNNWSYKFENLDKYKDGKEIKYKITEVPVKHYESKVEGFDVTNTHTPSKITINVAKEWVNNPDEENLPKSVKIRLFANDQPTDKVLNLYEIENWQGKFKDLDEYQNGVKIKYTIKEDKVPNYVTEITGDSDKGFVVTNTFNNEEPKPTKIDIPVEKIWEDNDNQDGIRPNSVLIKLYADKEFTGKTIELNPRNEWVEAFENLDLYNADGDKIEYTIEEEKVPGYTEYIEGNITDGFDVTNVHEPSKITIGVNKIWNDNKNQDELRPRSIKIKLLIDNKETGKTIELTEKDEWVGSFKDLDEFKNGKKINYSIEEINVKGYDSEITGNPKEGYVVTNTHIPTKTPEFEPEIKPETPIDTQKETEAENKPEFPMETKKETPKEAPKETERETKKESPAKQNTPAKPSKPGKANTPAKPSNPKTGDNFSFAVYILVASLSASILYVLNRKKSINK